MTRDERTLTEPLTHAQAFQKVWSNEPHILLCDIEARENKAVRAVNGECPFHGGDACLYVYVQVSGVRHSLAEVDHA